jgi:general stress protein 26
MDTDIDHARKEALAFLLRHKSGVLATVSPEGNVHASTIYYIATDDFNIYLLTLIDSRKYQALLAHPQVAFTVSTPEVPQTLQIEGVAMDISLSDEAAKIKEELFAVLNSNPWFYGPVSKLDPSMSAIVWIRPTWVRWADYAFAEDGDAHIFKEIPVGNQ